MDAPVRNPYFTALSFAVSRHGPLLFLLAALISPAHADTVAVPVDAVFGRTPSDAPERPAVGWMVSEGTTTVRPDGDVVHVDARLVLTPTDGPVWVSLRVLDG